MKIYLDKNWSKQITINDATGFYIGREKEIQDFKYKLLNDNGTFLISGVRGVGKTSFVYKTICELKKETSEEIFPILVNACQLDESNFSFSIIQTIIKSLYANMLIQKKNDDDLDCLYKKCFSDFSRTIEASFESEESKNNYKKFNFNWEFTINSLCSFASGILIKSENIFIRILGGILLALSTSLFSLTENINHNIKKNKAESAKEIYKFDNSPESLIYDLSRYFEKNIKKYKFVFVIDELDKLSSDVDYNLGVIKELKNFFNFTLANYIFISDQNLYKKLLDANRISDVSATLFSHFMYLSDSSYSDLKNYLNKIIQKIVNANGNTINKKDFADEDKTQFEVGLNYILYKSNLDFFDLKKNLDGFSHYDENGECYIDFDDFEEIESSDNAIKTKSVIIQIISEVLKAYNYHQIINQDKNQQSQTILFDSMKKFYSKNISYSTKENSIYATDNATEKESDTNNQHIYGLLDSLTRFSILECDKNEPKQYKWTGKLPKKLYDLKLTSLLPKEEEFIDKFNEYKDTVNDIDDLISSKEKQGYYKEIYESHDASSITGVNAFADYANYKNNIESLQKNVPDNISLERLESGIKLFESQLKRINENVLAIVANIIKKRNDLDSYTIGSLTSQQNISQILPSNPSLKNQIIKIANKVLYKNDGSKQIIFVKDYDANVNIPNDGKKNLAEQNNTVYLINIITKPELNKELSFEISITNKKGEIQKKLQVINKNYFICEFNNDFWIFDNLSETIKKAIETLN